MLKISHSIENSNISHVESQQIEPYIIFTVDNEEIGVEAQKVLELVKYLTPLRMPNKFANVNGMAIYRGQMIPIIDLRVIFGLEPVLYGDNTVTIVVESVVSIFGITAERVLDLNYIPLTSIKKVSALNFGEKTKYLKSVANFNGRLVLLLDPDKMIENQPVQTVLDEPAQVESLDKTEALGGIGEKGEETPITLPEQSPIEPGQTSSCLIDPQELEDLLKGAQPEPERPAPELPETDLTMDSIIEDCHRGDAQDIHGIHGEARSAQNDATMGNTNENFENLRFDPDLETEQLNPVVEIQAAAKIDRLMDQTELESILLQLEREKEAEQEMTIEASSLSMEDPDPVNLNDSPTDHFAAGILKPEEIAEVLSELESDGVMDLPEDLFKIETTAPIGTPPDQGDLQSLNEVIEGVIKELESKSDSKGQPSEDERKTGEVDV